MKFPAKYHLLLYMLSLNFIFFYILIGLNLLLFYWKIYNFPRYVSKAFRFKGLSKPEVLVGKCPLVTILENWMFVQHK